MEEHYLAEQEIRSLIIRERYYRDTMQWDKLRSSYHPDASKTSISVSWFHGDADEFVSRSIKMASGGTQSAHTITPVEVHINKAKALAESVGSVTIRLTVHDVEYDCVSWVRFITKLQKVDETTATGGTSAWKFLSLEVIYDRDSLTPTFPQSASPVPFDLSHGRESYKCLTWALSQRGFKASMDLPGTDDAESVKRLMEANHRWLSGS